VHFTIVLSKVKFALICNFSPMFYGLFLTPPTIKQKTIPGTIPSTQYSQIHIKHTCLMPYTCTLSRTCFQPPRSTAVGVHVHKLYTNRRTFCSASHSHTFENKEVLLIERHLCGCDSGGVGGSACWGHTYKQEYIACGEVFACFVSVWEWE